MALIGGKLQSGMPGLVIQHVGFNQPGCIIDRGHLVLSWPPSIRLSIPLLSLAAPCDAY